MFHPLDINAPIPVWFNNPFDYEPDALCRAAVKELQSKLPVNPIWKSHTNLTHPGKVF